MVDDEAKVDKETKEKWKKWWANRIIFNVLRDKGYYPSEEEIDSTAESLMRNMVYNDKKRALMHLHVNDLNILADVCRIIGTARNNGEIVSLYLKPDGRIYQIRKESEYLEPKDRVKILP
jgi:hypothetical protein